MRFISRRTLVVLAALFVLGATAATSALATELRPEFKPASGVKFPIAFSGTSGELGIALTGTGAYYTCKKATISGEVTGPKELGKVTLKFSEGTCALNWGEGFCWNGPSSWTTQELKGRIGYFSKATKSIGLLLEPTSGPVALCVNYEEELKEKHPYPEKEVLGSLITPIEPQNKQTTAFKLSSESGGHFEGEEAKHSLTEFWPFSKRTETVQIHSTFNLTTAQKLEIAA
jgi:hypothetical protein